MFTHENDTERNAIRIKRLGITIALIYYYCDVDSKPVAEVFCSNIDEFTKHDIDSYIKTEGLKSKFYE